MITYRENNDLLRWSITVKVDGKLAGHIYMTQFGDYFYKTVKGGHISATYPTLSALKAELEGK